MYACSTLFNLFLFTGELKVDFDSDITIITKNGKEYIQLVNPRLDFTVESFYLTLDNLFNGDKNLGKDCFHRDVILI